MNLLRYRGRFDTCTTHMVGFRSLPTGTVLGPPQEFFSSKHEKQFLGSRPASATCGWRIFVAYAVFVLLERAAGASGFTPPPRAMRKPERLSYV